MDTAYKAFLKDIKQFVDKGRVYTDDLRCLAWGTDAGFYHLIPKIVIRSKNATEMSRILTTASRHHLPVTFRAAGTSLSGQSISDSILIVAGKNWENYEISSDASQITLEPGIIGSRVNEYLKPYGRMFAPDPASKNSAMVGGIVINNASGMNCGTHANSDRILKSVEIILADGTILDTADAASRENFKRSHPEIIREITDMRDEILADSELTERIKYKYSIKNVTGLNLLPFVMYEDPFEIIAHCMVGSEGTLAFLSRVTVATSHLYKRSASAMLYFEDIVKACEAVVAMKKNKHVYSCELLDKKSLASVNDTTGVGLTALLLETKGDTDEELQENINSILETIKPFKLYKEAFFTSDPAVYQKWWSLRSGVFPAVGGTRPLGTTSLIEDIAFHIEDLPKATKELEDILTELHYDDACIYGHALEGNFHFIIAQSFDDPAEVERYKLLMDRIEQLVVDRYDGSLKAEHGTGRNMAPFVKKEWGAKAWNMMRRLKRIMDPNNLLNPGVIFNDDLECHIKGFKHLPLTNERVNKCIECGFCEVNCVSCGFTLSARQRIVVQREISYLEKEGSDPERLKRLKKQFKYLGNATCAGDGLCSTSCPMSINTGEMIHDIRQENLPPSSLGYKLGDACANHLSGIESTLKPILSVANFAHKALGDKATDSVGRALHKVGVPLWSSAMPDAAKKVTTVQTPSELKVVYFPSCINQTMGVTPEKGKEIAPLVQTMISLCNKAGYEVVFPKDMKKLCCGMIWESKGMPDIADRKTEELEKALLEASENGRYPVLCDQSPCLHRMRNHIKSMHLYEPAEFIEKYLAPRLVFTPIDEPVAVHVTCSTRHMGLADTIIKLASRCSNRVIVPTEIGCCGFAGDKGFMIPALNEWGLRKLRPQIVSAGVARGFSNSRTCEMGLTRNSGVPYKSIAYLVDEVTVAAQQNEDSTTRLIQNDDEPTELIFDENK
jgi:D-lactate dehydrogenase